MDKINTNTNVTSEKNILGYVPCTYVPSQENKFVKLTFIPRESHTDMIKTRTDICFE